jgi:hypothetical protein
MRLKHVTISIATIGIALSGTFTGTSNAEPTDPIYAAIQNVINGSEGKSVKTVTKFQGDKIVTVLNVDGSVKSTGVMFGKKTDVRCTPKQKRCVSFESGKWVPAKVKLNARTPEGAGEYLVAFTETGTVSLSPDRQTVTVNIARESSKTVVVVSEPTASVTFSVGSGADTASVFEGYVSPTLVKVPKASKTSKKEAPVSIGLENLLPVR